MSFLVLAFGMPSVCCAEEIVYESGGRRDPFSKLSAQAVAGESKSGVAGHLEGVIYDPTKQSLAVIDGKTYKAGEEVGDSTILRIQKDYVVVLVNGEEKTLRIREEEKIRRL